LFDVLKGKIKGGPFMAAILQVIDHRLLVPYAHINIKNGKKERLLLLNAGISDHRKIRKFNHR